MVLDGISENMASLVQSGMYGVIKTYDTTTNGFHVIQFLSKAYTLQNITAIDGQVISAGELVFKAQYLCSMQKNTNWYWKPQPLQHNVIVPTRTILHPSLVVIIIRYVQDIPKNICIINQSEKDTEIYPIIMADINYDYVLDEIERCEKNILKGM